MDVYNNVSSSLIKYCNGFITRHSLTSTCEPFDFDAHAVEGEMPEKDLIGIGEYTIENVDQHYMITALVCVCTMADDANLKRLRKITGLLFSELKPGDTSIKVVDIGGSPVGQYIGNLVIMDNVKALQIARSNTRPIQMIAVQFGSSFLTPP